MKKPDHQVDHVVEAIMLARMYAISRLRPYYATAIFRMVPVATRMIPTLGVDKWWRLYYNPDLVERLPVEQLATILVHEVDHLLRDHAGRCERNGWKHEHFNLAGDCEINDDLLREEEAYLPDWVISPKTYGLPDNLLAEEYYELIPAQASQGGGGDDFEIDGDESSCDGQQTGSRKKGHTCGSGAHGKKEEHELGSPNPDQRGIGEKEGDLVRKKIAEDVMDHASKAPGSVPAGLLRWAEAVLSPQVPWEKELAGAIRGKWARAAGMSDYSFSRPNRRQSVMGDFILPSLVDPTPNVAFCIDTSGSMQKEQLAIALAEAKSVLRMLGGEERLTVLCVDSMVHTTEKVFDPRQIQLSGGGGTDMGAGILEAAMLRPKPDFIIVMTDGYTPWPSEEPLGAKVIVVLIPDSRGFVGDGPSGWGRTISVKQPGETQHGLRLVSAE